MISRVGVGIIGFGTVGTGVAKILLENAALISRRVGVPIELVRIADLDVTRDRGVALPPGLLTTDAKQILADPSIDIVVELIGGCDAAKRIILESIAAGKHVVTANKALLALHGEEIFAAASRANIDLGFEASVGGGIPVIQVLREGLAANTIQSIYGIINGTANYILSRMTHEGQSFETVLDEAKQAGYAEADPTFDVAGIDSAHKLAILVALACWVLQSSSVTKSKPGCIPRCCRPHLQSPKSRESTTRFSLWAMRWAMWCSMVVARDPCRPAVRWSAISSRLRATS